MTGQQSGVLVTITVVSACYTAALVAVFQYGTSRLPAGIVRRLFRTGRPVTVNVNAVNSAAWDPSRPYGAGGFYAPGTATYSLVDGTSVHVVFRPRSGPSIERLGQIPTSLLPETPAARRRRIIARLVILVYLAIGGTTFGVTVALVHGTTSLRIRIAALAGLITVALTWLVTHLVLTRSRRKPPSAPRHLIAWAVGAVVATAALGVAWHLGNIDQPHPMSWASSFFSAAVFVLMSGAALTASLHHHTYIHHPDDHQHR